MRTTAGVSDLPRTSKIPSLRFVLQYQDISLAEHTFGVPESQTDQGNAIEAHDEELNLDERQALLVSDSCKVCMASLMAAAYVEVVKCSLHV